VDRLARVVGRARAEAQPPGIPFLVGVTGSVAVGKTTIAEQLARLLPGGVAVVSTDSFLLSNEILDTKGLGLRKGFPESFDLAALGAFVAEVRRGGQVAIPVYSHVRYDVVPGEVRVVGPADVVVLEGVAVAHVAELLDLTVYVDAAEDDIERWFVDRFLRLCDEGRSQPASFFARFAGLDREQAEALAEDVWRAVNLVNLREHIAPFRSRADVVVVKGPDHRVTDVERRGTR
jgi:type I pantothenate kinase